MEPVKAAFGSFAIDSETRQLRRGQAPLHLSPKAFDLLCLLLEHRPKVLEKADLHAQMWPDTHVVDGSLNVLITEIRRALGDDARDPRFIRTVHGVGYGFCGETTAESPATRLGTLRCWLTEGNKTYRLVEGPNDIGRDPECHVWLNTTSVSRHHARIVVDSRSARIALEDLGSKNGTLLKGTLVEKPVTLTDADTLSVGSVELTLHVWSSERASETKRITRKRTGRR
jgi:DNA-binding winged helix-turn-helix (wHTH) protein